MELFGVTDAAMALSLIYGEIVREYDLIRKTFVAPRDGESIPFNRIDGHLVEGQIVYKENDFVHFLACMSVTQDWDGDWGDYEIEMEDFGWKDLDDIPETAEAHGHYVTMSYRWRSELRWIFDYDSDDLREAYLDRFGSNAC